MNSDLSGLQLQRGLRSGREGPTGTGSQQRSEDNDAEDSPSWSTKTLLPLLRRYSNSACAVLESREPTRRPSYEDVATPDAGSGCGGGDTTPEVEVGGCREGSTLRGLQHSGAGLSCFRHMPARRPEMEAFADRLKDTMSKLRFCRKVTVTPSSCATRIPVQA